ncbi:CD63 antigen-like isoform X1 [Diaphorina citri]|uniref:Tetraspanin n=1 Tax=Diaphorina citri TaxID=121845 RepID=A0A1S4EED3_DIACI|nr:CD63 antigen-like isoform X2 [Diaphorina citri]XP_017300626.1 CD63 antigen-like isoform X1 [Diaphorina citri]
MKIKLSLGNVLIKYMLFAFNLIFVVTGIALLGFGFLVRTLFQSYAHFLTPKYFDVASTFVTVGSIVVVVAFLGCCGAIKESAWMVLTFSLLLGALFVIEIVGSAGSYVLSANAIPVIQDKFNETMKLYNHSQELTRVWDVLQSSLDCCGAQNYTDWYPILNESLPMSCCGDQIGAVGSRTCDAQSASLHRQPCLHILGHIIQDNAGSIAIVALGIAFLQMLGILFACTLGKSIRYQYQQM